MDKTILIAPGDGPLAAALAAEAAAGGWRCALAMRSGSSRPVAAPGAAAPEGGAELRETTPAGWAVTVPANASFAWNPASYVSASALAIAVTAALGSIEVLALVHDPAAPLPDLVQATPGTAASGIEEACLGPALLAREMLRRFAARGAGQLLLVTAERPADAAVGPSAALASGAFRGLGEGIFATTAASPGFLAWGVVEASGQAEPAARFALRLLEERKPGKAGRWLRFTGKPGLFGMF